MPWFVRRGGKHNVLTDGPETWVRAGPGPCPASRPRPVPRIAPRPAPCAATATSRGAWTVPPIGASLDREARK